MNTISTQIHPVIQVFCNDYSQKYRKRRNAQQLELEYRDNIQSSNNVVLNLPAFIDNVYHLPDRICDLLEIAAYVFCADRMSFRGDNHAVEYHKWSREFEFFVKVRDAAFWNSPNIKDILQNALTWMTGDRSYNFFFQPGHKTDKSNFFDSPEHSLSVEGSPCVTLFSGGLDSLAGIVHLLETTKESIYPISHRSQNPSTIKTQRKLIEALHLKYPHRIHYSLLKCHLNAVHAAEESQRTRAFLYCAMGLAMAVAVKQSTFYVFENGITALNFAKQEDMFLARASRTVHPKTMKLLQSLFQKITDSEFKILTPFANNTKADVIRNLQNHGGLDLLNSSVSCSRAREKSGSATHCGSCSQCIDRRFAAYASQCESQDDGGIYSFDFINEAIDNGVTRTAILDYLRQAYNFLHSNLDRFATENAVQLTDAIDPNGDEEKQIDEIYNLCQRHGQGVKQGANRMISALEKYPDGSLSTLLYSTDFDLPPAYHLADKIAGELDTFIRKAYSRTRPTNENDLNDKIDGFLSGQKEKYDREHPSLIFAMAKVIPDHSNAQYDLLIETKYIRSSTTPSKASEGISADLIKYPNDALKLFIVYDPDLKISDRKEFKRDFETKGKCLVYVI